MKIQVELSVVEYAAIEWAYHRLQFEVKKNLLQCHSAAGEKVVKHLKSILERAENQIEVEE